VKKEICIFSFSPKRKDFFQSLSKPLIFKTNLFEKNGKLRLSKFQEEQL